jgi:hypothetical protein
MRCNATHVDMMNTTSYIWHIYKIVIYGTFIKYDWLRSGSHGIGTKVATGFRFGRTKMKRGLGLRVNEGELGSMSGLVWRLRFRAELLVANLGIKRSSLTCYDDLGMYILRRS